MKNNLLFLISVCLFFAFCPVSANAQSVKGPSLLADTSLIVITPDYNTSMYWYSYSGQYRVRFNQSTPMRFYISVRSGYENARVQLSPWSFESSWSSFDAEWMFSHSLNPWQGFMYSDTDGLSPYSGHANNWMTELPYPNTTISFSVPTYSPGNRTGTITVSVGNYKKTISIWQTTF